MRTTRRAVLCCLAVALVGCGLRIPEGHYSCEPDDPSGCPAEFHCLLRAGGTAPRCYRGPTPACGNEMVEGDEQCDGPYRGPRTCRDHGFFTGTLSCSDNCLLTTDACVGFQAVSSGVATACGLDTRNRLWCWGHAASGLLGGIFAAKVEQPVRSTFYPGLGFQDVSVGATHLCALDLDGGVSCRGSPSFGQSPGPKALAVGHVAACGIDGDGRAVCYHNGGWAAAAPTDTRYAQFATGASHQCVLDVNHRAWCWGDNSRGQLGVGSGSGGVEPVAKEVEGGLDFSAIATGAVHTCGVERDTGQVWCWGGNHAGQIGDGSLEDRNVPRPVRTEGDVQPHFTAIGAGHRHSCALDKRWAAWCWGQFLGDARPVAATGAVSLFEGRTFRSLSAGRDYTCGTTEKTILCWGWNGFGQIGVPSRHDRPQPLLGDATFTSIDAGFYHSCGIDTAGRVICWGLNDAGQLGTPWAVESQRVVMRRANTEIVFDTVAVGYRHSCGLDRDGRVWCWGENRAGQLGSLTDADAEEPAQSHRPLPLGMPDPHASTTFAKLSVGGDHSCGIDTEGKAWCWGDNAYGQLGDVAVGSRSWQPVAVPPPAQRRWVQIAAGERHSCVLADDQTAWCWGDNRRGQLGREGSNTSAPAEVVGGHHFSALATGGGHSCGVAAADGQVWCWGQNRRGALGFESTQVYFFRPEKAPGLIAEWITAGAEHTCALTKGAARCWGYGAQGRLGRPAGSDVQTVLDIGHDVVAISAGTSHTCALDERGKGWCWGDNAFGRLGVDDFVREPVAVDAPLD